MSENKWRIKHAVLALFGIAVLFLAGVALMPAFPRSATDQNLFLQPHKGQSEGVQTVRLAGKKIEVFVADTPKEKTKGLGGRMELSPAGGMLFIFEDDDYHGSWMKDMLFSIDILWISSDGKIVDMLSRVSPATYPAVFISRAPARYVLELSAGFAEGHRVKIGDEVGM